MVSQTKPVPEGYHAVTPSLTLKNSAEAVDFYKKAFNAEVIELLPMPGGKGTMHAAIRIGNSIVMMGDEMPGEKEGCKSAESLGASPVSLFVYVPNADAIFKQAIAAGAKEVMAVADMFWGDRCGTLKDPFGYSWTIATHIKDLSRSEVMRAAESFFTNTKKS